MMLNNVMTRSPELAQWTNGVMPQPGKKSPRFTPIFKQIIDETNQQQAMALTMINEMAQLQASNSNLNDMLNRLLNLMVETFKAETGAVLLTDPTSGELVLQGAVNKGKLVEGIETCRLPVEYCVCSYVAQYGKPVLMAGVTSRQRGFIKLAAYLPVEPHSLLCIPLTIAERVIGVLVLINKTDGTFTHEDLNLLKPIAAYAALAIENARLHEQMLVERKRVMAVETQARQAVARDLHDGPTQLVSAMLMRLDFCQQAIQKNPALLQDELAPLQELGQQAVHQMRTMLVELRPLELEPNGLGLAAALRFFLERRQKEVKNTQLILEEKSHCLDQRISRLAPDVEGAIYAIVQETVNNALKHAQAERIVVRLEETPEMLRVVIADNGRGFDVNRTIGNYAQRGSLGMLNIQERAETIGGELSLTSTPGEGTRINVTVPK